MPFPVLEGRRSKCTLSKAPRARLIVNLDRNQEPCLVLYSSKDGFRVRGSFHLRRGQIVEVVLDEDPLNALRCSVVWIIMDSKKQRAQAWKPAL